MLLFTIFFYYFTLFIVFVLTYYCSLFFMLMLFLFFMLSTLLLQLCKCPTCGTKEGISYFILNLEHTQYTVIYWFMITFMLWKKEFWIVLKLYGLQFFWDVLRDVNIQLMCKLLLFFMSFYKGAEKDQMVINVFFCLLQKQINSGK